MFEFIDTHCHIHEPSYPLPVGKVLTRASNSGITKMICVGTAIQDSSEAVEFVADKKQLWASIGIHPHSSDEFTNEQKINEFAALLKSKKVIAIGECGLDYFYNHTPKKSQEKALRIQMELALEHDLPMIFHVRDAFEDFWKIYDSYPRIRGVIHSFSATKKELDEALSRGLYIGLNGIMTFSKIEDQLEAAKLVPLTRLVLETDSPFLTPNPLRGRINEPKNVVLVADFLGQLRGEKLEQIALHSTNNAESLFNI